MEIALLSCVEKFRDILRYKFDYYSAQLKVLFFLANKLANNFNSLTSKRLFFIRNKIKKIKKYIFK